MTNFLFVIRAKKRDGDSSVYKQLRLRDQAGEFVDYLPDGAWPGNAIIDDNDFRIVRVTGAGMTEAIAMSLCSNDTLSQADIGNNILPRAKIWQIDWSLLPAVVKNALRVKVPFAVRGTIYDASYSLAQIQGFLKQKKAEPRDGQGQPTDDGETLPDLG